MTREEAIQRILVDITCMVCTEEMCYDKNNVSTCQCNETKEKLSLIEALDMAIKALEQEPKTGRWTADKKCSRCGCSSMLKLCIENYCANCGAKMQEVEK